MASLNGWIRQSVEENKPWDQFARELVQAQGSAFKNGPTNFYRSSNSPQELAETTAQAFLGVRIQCAKCHNHPYERWTQSQYYQMAAFFARVKSKPGERNGETVVYASSTGEVTHPKTQKQVTPCALDATPLVCPLRITEGGVQNGNLLTESLEELAGHCGGERDFGHQQQSILA